MHFFRVQPCPHPPVRVPGTQTEPRSHYRLVSMSMLPPPLKKKSMSMLLLVRFPNHEHATPSQVHQPMLLSTHCGALLLLVAAITGKVFWWFDQF